MNIDYISSDSKDLINFISERFLKAATPEDLETALLELQSRSAPAHAYLLREWVPVKHRLCRPFIRRVLTLGKVASSLAECGHARVKKMFLTSARAPSLPQITSDLVQLDKLDYEQELFNHSRNVVHFQDKVVSPKIMAKIEAQRSLADFYTVNAISVDDLVNSEAAAFNVTRSSKSHRVSLFGDILRCDCVEDSTSGYPDRHVQAVASFLRKKLDYSDPEVVIPRWRIPRAKPVKRF